ncbi:hypothetical protein GYMC52_2491 [Geobacillus sp. Y412MC52]|nr:hypothetical protein GYMC52_2491 [Geobacillus sp. Y412MC52]
MAFFQKLTGQEQVNRDLLLLLCIGGFYALGVSLSNTFVNIYLLTFRTLTRSKQRIFYLVFQNNFLTNTTSDGNPFFTIASRSVSC